MCKRKLQEILSMNVLNDSVQTSYMLGVLSFNPS